MDIPARIYNPNPATSAVDALSRIEHDILACIYTRHHDGRVRQHWLSHVPRSREPWTVPFVVQLCGEYVIEICRDVELFATSQLPADELLYRNVAAFFRDNPGFVHLTERRALSYWDAYHRTSYERSDYPGLVALAALSSLAHS